ncbi:MAG: divergent PAP2 family protein [Dehalococcoidales bacterium]|nr:divergent PAP2 family protein [Dehalococcoidales bacterium]
MFYDLITNKAAIIPFCAWVITQLIKTLVALVEGKGFDLSYFISSGGMPSAHSATVCALATTVAMTDGLGSTPFAISAVLALIVMYDAAGIRQSVGKQSVVLNRIVRELREKQPLIKLEAELRELVGHTPFQVFVGAILGVTIAWLWVFLSRL